MKLYRVALADSANYGVGWHVCWQTNAHGAKATLRVMQDGQPKDPLDNITVVDVPTTKEALVEWLNKNAVEFIDHNPKKES